MPRLTRVVLSGDRLGSPFRKRQKRVVLTATIVWDERGDAARNGLQMFVQFFGDDGGETRGDDSLHANVHAITKGTGEATLDGALGYRLNHSQDGDVTTVRISYENTANRGGIGGRRRFNEDVASRDEIFAKVELYGDGDPIPTAPTLAEGITNRLDGRW